MLPHAAWKKGKHRSQQGMGKPESGDSGPFWPSDTKVEEAPFKVEDEGPAQDGQVTKHAHELGGGGLQEIGYMWEEEWSGKPICQ